MKRRAFLGLLGALSAQAAYDPERALWVPGRKLISVPAPPSVPEEIVTITLTNPASMKKILLRFGGLTGKYLGSAFLESRDGTWTLVKSWDSRWPPPKPREVIGGDGL